MTRGTLYIEGSSSHQQGEWGEAKDSPTWGTWCPSHTPIRSTKSKSANPLYQFSVLATNSNPSAKLDLFASPNFSSAYFGAMFGATNPLSGGTAPTMTTTCASGSVAPMGISTAAVAPSLQQQEHNTNEEPMHGRRGKKSKQDYSTAFCAICNAQADGLHYGAISCRSCNAFFRRAVTYKQHFICRKGGNCDVDVGVRCACRSCRLAKCKWAGMRESDVQPKRDPTGSQKNRRAPQRKRNSLLGDVKTEQPSSVEDGQRMMTTATHWAGPQPHVTRQISTAGSNHSPNTLLPSVESYGDKGHEKVAAGNAFFEENPYQTAVLSPSANTYFPPSAESGIVVEDQGAIQFIKSIKSEANDEEEEGPQVQQTTSGTQRRAVDATAMHQLAHVAAGNADQRAFDALVHDYHEHLIWMNRAMTPIEAFLSKEYASCSKWRMMEPQDVEQLSKVELSGLMYWIEKLHPYAKLDQKERTALFKRYGIRKLCLDHFYTASKYPELIAKGNFAMLNNTYVPPHLTGFETTADDAHSRVAKFEILRPTIDRLWSTIVLPFSQMQITDAEIVTLHLMLMWSAMNNAHVSVRTRDLMRQQREWTVNRLHQHYVANGVGEPSVRLGEILLILPELEVICDLHCKDFQVAQLFEFCNMSDYWYEQYCYTTANIA